MPENRRPLTKRRPAETGTAIAGAAVALIIWGLEAAGISVPGQVVAAMTVLVAAIPSGITYLVELRRSIVAGE